jgi:hypothetical protein
MALMEKGRKAGNDERTRKRDTDLAMKQNVK